MSRELPASQLFYYARRRHLYLGWSYSPANTGIPHLPSFPSSLSSYSATRPSMHYGETLSHHAPPLVKSLLRTRRCRTSCVRTESTIQQTLERGSLIV